MRLKSTGVGIRKQNDTVDPAIVLDGISAYQLWLTAGNSGTEADYMAAMRGAAGANAWTPVLGAEEDGTARYLRVTDWQGGSGTKPALGYIGVNGVGVKANATNFNAAKRVMAFSAVSNAQGIASVTFGVTPAFANVPNAIIVSASTNLVAVTVRATIVAGSLTKTGVQIKLESVGIVGGLVGLLVGGTVNLLVIEV